MPQWYTPPQYAPQPYMPARYPQQSQANPVLDSIATQIANIAVAMDRRQEATDRRQETVQNELTSKREVRTNPATAPALKPGDVATSEPRNQTDSNAASRFIDSIHDAVSHYGEELTRVVLRRCCKETATEDWLAGMLDHDRTRLRTSCGNWVAILERDFMLYLASRLSAACAETFRWDQGRTPGEYIAKKLRLLRMANVTNSDDIVEELHSGFVRAPSLYLHLDKYVTEGGNSVSEYRRAVGCLQDSARYEGNLPFAQPLVRTVLLFVTR